MGRIFLSILLSLGSSFAEASEKARYCTERSSGLVATLTVKFPEAQGWAVHAKQTGSEVTCHGKKQFSDGLEVHAIHVPKGKYRGGHWFLSVAGPNRGLPDKFQAKAELVVDGRKNFSGEIFHYPQDVKGQSSPWFRAEFPQIDESVPILKAASKIEVSAALKTWRLKEIPEVQVILRLLEDCALKTTGPNSKEFWENAVSSCG